MFVRAVTNQTNGIDSAQRTKDVVCEWSTQEK